MATMIPGAMQPMQYVLMPVPMSVDGQALSVAAPKAEQGKGKRADGDSFVKQPPPAMMMAIPPAASAGVYGGIQNHGVQQYLPIAEKRELGKAEEKSLEKGGDRWWPKLGAGYATPMAELMANPAKSATLGAIGTGFVSAVMGGFMLHNARLVGAAAGLLGGSVLGGFGSFVNRRQQNENIVDLMKRLPPGATKRDMLSDPVYQQELTQRAMRQSNSSGNIATLALMSSMMGGGGTARR